MSFTFQNPFAYFNNPANSNPVGLGKLYIGLPDTDPVTPANQVPVFAVQPDGSELPIPQPVRMTAGGVLTYNGTPIQLKVSESTYSVRIDSSANAQLYYTPRAETPIGGGGTAASINGIKSLQSVTEPAVNTVYDVIGYYEDTTVGGGGFVWEATRPYSDHNGGTVIAPPAIAAWDGTQADIAAILNWTPVGGVGCWVRVGKITGIIPASWFGATSSGNQAVSIAAANKTGYRVDLTGMGLLSVSSPTTAANGLRLISFDDYSGISGYNGLGYSVSGGDITLENIRINNFYDGTDQNKTNYATAFCRVPTGSTIGKVVLRNVKANNCRSLVTTGAATNETAADTSISTSLLKVIGCEISNTASPINWRSLCERSEAVGNVYTNIIGAGRIVAAHAVFVDGVAHDSPFYNQVQNHLFAHNYVDTVVNRTTTGDSTANNNYECHAAMLSGKNVHIHDNIVIDCTGNRFDTEGFYTKAKYSNIHNNLLIDGGAEEAAINIKGINEDGSLTDTSPVGDRSKCHSNIIVFTRESYDNGGTIIDLSNRLRGIRNTAPSNSSTYSNIIVGANANDISIRGNIDSKNESCHVYDNTSYLFKGADSIVWDGAFYNPVSRNNTVIDPIIPSAIGSFYHTRFIGVTNRGIKNTNVDCTNNKLVCDVSDGRFNGKRIALNVFDTLTYDYEGVRTGGGTYDVVIGPATPLMYVNYVTASVGTDVPTAKIYDLVATKDDIKTPNALPWVFGNSKISNYDIEFMVKNTLTAAAASLTISQYPAIADKAITLDAKTDFSFPTAGENGTKYRMANYYLNAGVATLQNKADLYAYRSVTTCDQDLSVDATFCTVRLFNAGTDSLRSRTIGRAVCI